MTITLPNNANASAIQAMAAGDRKRAREILERAIALEPNSLQVWLNYAGLLRASGEEDAAMDALTQALRVEPRSFHALLMKGLIHDKRGHATEAGRAFALALTFAPPADRLDAATNAALDRARDVYQTYIDGLTDQVWQAVNAQSSGHTQQERRRLNKFIDLATGKIKRYDSHPSDFFFPDLPQLEFYDDELFPWLKTYESYTPHVIEEFTAYAQRGMDGFKPYVSIPVGAPVDQWGELNNSVRWTSLLLKKNGKVVEEYAPLFPKTLEALSHVDQPVTHNRSPVSMISALQPHTRIPPHHGVSNARLVLHLPLIVPENCGFRVGSETREWVVGKAWVFDDCVEHEAWNGSDKLRVVLLADVWNPFLTTYERDQYDVVLRAMDTFHNELELPDSLAYL